MDDAEVRSSLVVAGDESVKVPKRLRDRWRPESINEFRAAARQRFDDGLALAAQGRRTGALYLWGYSAEMVLKAGYFSLNLAGTDPIDWKSHILAAIDHGRKIRKIFWPAQGQGHNVRAWAELLVAERAATPGRAYSATISREIQANGQRIGSLWNETLRHHGNLPYEYEMKQVREAAEWLLANLETL